MSNEVVVIPKVIVHPEKIVCVKTVQREPGYSRERKFEHLIKSDSKHHGKVSDQARRKIGRAVEYLLFMANDKILPDTAHGKAYNFKLAFITLTLPSTQAHDDNFIKKNIFNQWLVEARKYWKVKNYVWRAEKQGNGNIHFHVLTNKFVPWNELRSAWNRICNKYGYVDRYRDQMLAFHAGGMQVRDDLLKQWDYKAQVKAYQKGKANDWSNPNSTDVHSLVHIHNVKNYIVKYCTKDETNQEVIGRMWGCSESLSNISGAGDIMDSFLANEVLTIVDKIPKKVYHSDYFTVIHVSSQQLQSLGCKNLYELFCSYMFDEFNFSVQTMYDT